MRPGRPSCDAALFPSKKFDETADPFASARCRRAPALRYSPISFPALLSRRRIIQTQTNGDYVPRFRQPDCRSLMSSAASSKSRVHSEIYAKSEVMVDLSPSAAIPPFSPNASPKNSRPSKLSLVSLLNARSSGRCDPRITLDIRKR
jgi:hypothetical protein